MSEQLAPYKAQSTLQQVVEKYKGSLAAVIPKGSLDPERFFKLALLAEVRQPELKRADIKSLVLALMEAASLGLDVSGNLGHAYLVPFVDRKAGLTKAQLIVGYRGYIYLAHKSNSVTDIWAEVVYKNDKFKITYGLHRDLVHEPDISSPKRDEDIIGTYAVATLPNGNTHFIYLDRSQLESIKARSKAKEYGPWVTDFAIMCKKTAVRALIKMLPLSQEEQIGRAVMIEESEDAELPVAVDVPPLPEEVEAQPERKSDRILGNLARKRGRPPIIIPAEEANAPIPNVEPETPQQADQEKTPEIDDSALRELLLEMGQLYLLNAREKWAKDQKMEWQQDLADLAADPETAWHTLVQWWRGLSQEDKEKYDQV